MEPSPQRRNFRAQLASLNSIEFTGTATITWGNQLSELHIRNLGEVRKALAKAARTDASTADSVVDRFIELMPGLQDKLSAERHQLLTGRRGTGKSTLLFVLRKNLRSKQIPVAILDMEKYNGRDYPDVLIEVLMALLREIQPKVTFKEFFPRLRLKWKMSSLESELGQMLTDPQRLVKKFNRQVNRKRDGGAQVALKGQYSGHGAGASGSVQHTRNDEETTVGEYEEFKIQRLQTIAARISDLLVEVMKASPNGYAVVFLDDYYFVPIKDQPSVLGYLHQICKGTGVWLKVGGVGSRLHPFVDGHPPVGMEPGHDLSVVPLDVTLADFATARKFFGGRSGGGCVSLRDADGVVYWRFAQPNGAGLRWRGYKGLHHPDRSGSR